MQEQLSDGQSAYAMGAVHPTVLWTLAGPLGPFTLAAKLDADGHATRLSIIGNR